MQIKNQKKYFSLNELAKAFGIEKALIRSYAKKRLLAPVASQVNGPSFSPCDKRRLQLMTHARSVDISLTDIEKLIGRISPHLSEADKLDESLSYAEKKFNQMQLRLKDLDMLEQINVSCDFELLGPYLRDLSALKSKSHLIDFARRNHQKPKKPVGPSHSEPAKQPRTIANPGKQNAFKASSGPSKKIFFGAIIIVLITAGYLFLGGSPEPAQDVALSDQKSSEDIGVKPAGSTQVTENLENEPHEKTPPLPLPPTDGGVVQQDNLASLLSGMTDPQDDVASPSPGTDAATEDFLAELKTPADLSVPEDNKTDLLKLLMSDLTARYNLAEESSPILEKKTLQDDVKPVETTTSTVNDAPKAAAAPVVVIAAKPTQKPVSKPTSSAGSIASGTAVSQPKASPKPQTNKVNAANNKPADLPDQKGETSRKATPEKTSVREKPSAAAVAKTTSSNTGTATAASPKKDLSAQKKEQPVTTASKAPSKKSASTQAPDKASAERQMNPAAMEWAEKSRESFNAGDVGETIVAATVAISLDPGLTSPYVDRAWAYTRKGLYEKAIADSTRALEIDPKNALAYSTRGAAYQAAGRASKARLDYEKACDLGNETACAQKEGLRGGDSIDGLLSQSRENFRKREWDAVISASSQVLQIDPDNVIAYINRSAAYLQKGSFQKAISDCDQALKVDPDYSMAFNNRGYALERLGKQNDAVKDYKKACSLGLKLGCQNYEKF